MRAAPVERYQFAGSGRRYRAEIVTPHVVDGKAADGYFGADIQEDGDGAEPDVMVLPDGAEGIFSAAGGAEFLRGLETRQLDQGDRDSEQDKRDPDACVGRLDRGRLLLARHIGKPGGSGKDEHAAEVRRDGGSQRIECLGQIQAAGRGLRRPEDGDVGIGGNLQGGDAGGEDDLRGEKEGIRWHAGSGQEEEDAHSHDAETNHHGALVADGLNQLGGGLREDKVTAEEREIDQLGLGVVQLEDLLEMRDERIVQRGEKAPHEEERCHDGQRPAVVRAAAL